MCFEGQTMKRLFHTFFPSDIDKQFKLTVFPSRTQRSQGRPSLQLRLAATHTLQARFTYLRRFVRGPSADCIVDVNVERRWYSEKGWKAESEGGGRVCRKSSSSFPLFLLKYKN